MPNTELWRIITGDREPCEQVTSLECPVSRTEERRAELRAALDALDADETARMNRKRKERAYSCPAGCGSSKPAHMCYAEMYLGQCPRCRSKARETRGAGYGATPSAPCNHPWHQVCPMCQSIKPVGQSCGCFDNNCQ